MPPVDDALRTCQIVAEKIHRSRPAYSARNPVTENGTTAGCARAVKTSEQRSNRYFVENIFLSKAVKTR